MKKIFSNQNTAAKDKGQKSNLISLLIKILIKFRCRIIAGDSKVSRIRYMVYGLLLIVNFSAMNAQFTEEQKLLAQVPGFPFVTGPNDNAGRSVAIDGDLAIVGVPFSDISKDNSGMALIYRKEGDDWVKEKALIPSDASDSDQFGFSVSISGNLALVGAHLDDDNGLDTGSAYIFQRDLGGTGNWGEVTKLITSDIFIGEHFGYSVSISDNVALVGATDDNTFTSNSSAYIFERDVGGTNNWGEVKKLKSSDFVMGDLFGQAVSVSGDIAVVGASGNDDNGNSSGSAYVFERDAGGTGNWGEVKKLTSLDANSNDFFGISVSVSGNIVLVGAYFDDDNESNSGSAYIFERNSGGIGNWGEVKKLTASDGSAGERFGGSVAVSGDIAIVGARFAGSAYIFERGFGGIDNWGEVKRLTSSDAEQDEQFGRSVAISNEIALVGADLNNDNGLNSGASYIFEQDSGGDANWGELSKLTASKSAASDNFGFFVSISGDVALVGSRGYDDFRGAAYIFERDSGGSGNWVQIRKLTASDGSIGDRFGTSVWVSGDVALVGARSDDDNGTSSGSAYIFERNQGGVGNWGELRKLTASDASSGDQFGSSVSISGDVALIGATFDEDNNISSGSAYIFERNAGGTNNWGEVQKLRASDAPNSYFFGESVSISGNLAIIGASTNEGGATYIFERNQGGTNNWGEVKKLTASDAALADRFGNSVSVSGDVALVGAYLNDENGRDSGSAYIFERNAGGTNNWGQVKKLTASNASAFHLFGSSVSILGDVALVGEASNSENVRDTGAAYIFERNAGGTDNWGEVQKLTASDGLGGDVFGNSVSLSSDFVLVGALGNDDNGSSSGSAYIYSISTNSEPAIVSAITIDFEENTTSNVIDIESSDDADSEGNGLSYSFTTNDSGGIDNALFNLNENTGELSFIVVPDFENPIDSAANNEYLVQVTVTDSGGLSATQDLVITVTDDPDEDDDGTPDVDDDFPNDPNETTDSDGDGMGNNADTDDDNDGTPDDADAFPLDETEDTDTDEDGVGDNSDAFPNDPNETADTDGDGVGDNADDFPDDPNETNDTDGDGMGDNADTDDDNDGFSDSDENSCGSDPLSASDVPNDSDGDFIADCLETETDTDGDGINDADDNCPNEANADQADNDGDGIGDACDDIDNGDDDSDGIINEYDQCDTPNGRMVNAIGCEIIAPGTISITANSTICPGKNNGGLNIRTSRTFNTTYDVFISGNNASIQEVIVSEGGELYSNTELFPGHYDIEIAISDINFTQNFQVVVNDIEDLSGKSGIVDESSRSVSYKLESNKMYWLTLNGKTTIEATKGNGILVVVLKEGKNDINIKTEKDCQGQISEEVNFSDISFPFPNPTTDVLWLSHSDNVPLQINDLTGKLIWSGNYDKSKGLDVSRYPAGIFILTVKEDNGNVQALKFIKQ